MQETKNPAGNSCILCDKNDEAFSWIEKELEEKLWAIYDNLKSSKPL